MPIKEIKEQIREICTYHGDEGTSGFLLDEDRFAKIFALLEKALKQNTDMKKETLLEKEIYRLATEIWYSHGKDVDYTLDDWAKKIEALLSAERKRVGKVIDERIEVLMRNPSREDDFAIFELKGIKQVFIKDQ